MLRMCLGGKGRMKTWLGASGLFKFSGISFFFQNQRCDPWLSYANGRRAGNVSLEEITQNLLGLLQL